MIYDGTQKIIMRSKEEHTKKRKQQIGIGVIFKKKAKTQDNRVYL